MAQSRGGTVSRDLHLVLSPSGGEAWRAILTQQEMLSLQILLGQQIKTKTQRGLARRYQVKALTENLDSLSNLAGDRRTFISQPFKCGGNPTLRITDPRGEKGDGAPPLWSCCSHLPPAKGLGAGSWPEGSLGSTQRGRREGSTLPRASSAPGTIPGTLAASPHCICTTTMGLGGCVLPSALLSRQTPGSRT